MAYDVPTLGKHLHVFVRVVGRRVVQFLVDELLWTVYGEDEVGFGEGRVHGSIDWKRSEVKRIRIFRQEVFPILTVC